MEESEVLGIVAERSMEAWVEEIEREMQSAMEKEPHQFDESNRKVANWLAELCRQNFDG